MLHKLFRAINFYEKKNFLHAFAYFLLCLRKMDELLCESETNWNSTENRIIKFTKSASACRNCFSKSTSTCMHACIRWFENPLTVIVVSICQSKNERKKEHRHKVYWRSIFNFSFFIYRYAAIIISIRMNKPVLFRNYLFNMIQISKHYLICKASEINLCENCSLSNFNDRKTIIKYSNGSENVCWMFVYSQYLGGLQKCKLLHTHILALSCSRNTWKYKVWFRQK